MANKKNENLREALDAQNAALVEQFCADLETKGFKWVNDMVQGKQTFSHHNPLTMKDGKTYNGRNSMELCLAGIARNYSDNRWATLHEIQANGWTLKETAKPVYVDHWSRKAKRDDEGRHILNEDGSKKLNSYATLDQVFALYNYNEIDGVPKPIRVKRGQKINEDETLATIYTVMQAWEAYSGCKFVENEHVEYCHYNFATHEIHMPPVTRFKSNRAFAATMLHEICHSTGHHSLLGRKMDGDKRGKNYAREELIAEIGSAFLEQQLNIKGIQDKAHYKQHMAYLQSWCARFRKKPDMIFQAATKSQQAARMVMDAVAKYQATIPQEYGFDFVDGIEALVA